MEKVGFMMLWHSHPGRDTRPCDKHANQCAIRMAIALKRAGVDFSSFKGEQCTHGHILRAQELAKWISDDSINQMLFGQVNISQKIAAKSSDFLLRQGLVFFMDGHGAMDHIDLWNGYVLKAASPSEFSSAKEIWFWDLPSRGYASTFWKNVC